MMWPFLVALTIAGAIQPLLIPWLRVRAILDVPNHRSSHQIATPRGGGIAVTLGVVVALSFVADVPKAVVLAVLAMAVLGLLDDFVGLPAGLRLVAQVSVAAGVSVGLVSDRLISAPTAALVVGVTSWFVFYVNAFNFMDGINGISGLQAAVIGVAFVGMGQIWNVESIASWGAAIAGGGLAFLPYNMVHARVFLGDVGSYGLGAAVSSLVAFAMLSGVPVWAALSPTLIYCFDVLLTLARRARAREVLHQAHRMHVYQRLTDEGLTHLIVATLLGVSSAAMAALALTAKAVPAWTPFCLLATIVALGAYAAMPGLIRRIRLWRAATGKSA